MKSRFDFESLDVFKCALRYLDIAESIASAMPSGHSRLAEQLRTEAESILQNIGEGAGEWTRAEKARFYRYARRSATEGAAAICGVEHKRFVDARLTDAARDTLLPIIGMLTGLIKGCRKPRGQQGAA